MATKIILGAQWGDEGKGKLTDIEAQRSDVVARSQGGHNAGHTVEVGGVQYKLQLTPFGILNPHVVCLIGPGVVIDPKTLINEIDMLTSRGVSVANLKIDPRAHVVMPYHPVIDALSEAARGEGDIGTTKKGIGPAYMDKVERSGIRICDLINKPVFEKKVRDNLAIKNKIITLVYGGTAVSADEVISEYNAYANRLRSFVADTTVILHKAIADNKRVLFEGAQAALLDIDMGTYPYVTSSHPVAGGVCVGSGVGPTVIDECIGVAKSYTTRVGKGPFPTELFDEVGDTIRTKGFEFGTVTGRPRRCGWFDAVIIRYAARVNGLTSIMLNKLDPLTGFDKLKICVAYKKNGEILHDFPASLEELALCEPVYEEIDGWKEDITKARTKADLPQSVLSYISRVEEICGVRVSVVGVGPGRDQVIEMK